MKHESYWLDTAPSNSNSYVSCELNDKADVIVIGGGFTGLSSALCLAKRGAETVILEAGDVIGEASGRNGGQCNNGTAQSFSDLVKGHGIEQAKCFYQAYNQAVDTIEALIKREEIDCDFSRNGKLKLAAKPAHFEGLKQAAQLLKTEGVDPNVELLTAADLSSEISCDGFYGGLLYPDSAKLHVGKFGHGLALAAVNAGAKIHANTPATNLEKSASGSWIVTTPRGKIEATQVLVATGGSGPGPFGWFRRRIVPVGSFAIVTEPLPTELIEQLLPGKRNYVTTRHIGNYFRVTPDQRLLFGGRARFAVSNPKSDQQGGVILRQTLAKLMPELKDVGVDYCWGGTVDMSADRLPRAGQHNGLYYSMGYSGHGVQMAVHMGEIMANLIEGKTTRNPWQDLNWPAVPGHFGKPWFLPVVGLYYQLLDRTQ